jgi:hypothetical protein
MKNIINNLIDNFVKKILIIESEQSTLENKINLINGLLDNLIDFCIKKKIMFYIEKKIGYNKIINSFKLHLITYIQKLIDPFNNIINDYVLEQTDNFNNYSDINSLLFRKFKDNNQISNTKNIKNKKVTFIDNIIAYDCNNEFEFNYLNSNNETDVNNQTDNEIDVEKLALYIKILLSQNKFLIEFVEKLNLMCTIISDPDILYNEENPFN